MVASVNVGTTSSPRSRRNGTTAAAPGDAAPAAAAAAWSDDLGLESQPGADNWLDQLAPPLPGVAPGRGPAPPGPDRDPRKAHVVAPPQAVPPAVVAEVQMPPDYNPLHPPRAKELAPRHARVERRVRERRNADRRAGVGSAPASADLAALLAGAGLEGLPVTPEVARQFGEILRVVVAGVLDVLRARQEVKGEFRIRPTIIQRRRNNPLKHSTDAQDALHNLLLKKGSGYLGPVEAFEDAFNDLRNHQLAMLAGVRVAFDAMFSQFDPERLQKEFDRHTPRARKGSSGRVAAQAGLLGPLQGLGAAAVARRRGHIPHARSASSSPRPTKISSIGSRGARAGRRARPPQGRCRNDDDALLSCGVGVRPAGDGARGLRAPQEEAAAAPRGADRYGCGPGGREAQGRPSRSGRRKM